MISDISMRPALPLSPLLLLFTAIPGHAQPTPPLKEGPWAADADGDGRITREEMGAYMERRFSLMDSDGDGMIPAQTMQRMLGHERSAPGIAAQDSKSGGRRGPGSGMEPGGGGGFGGSGGAGGPPPRGGPAADGQDHMRQGRADGTPPPPPGRAMPYPEDSNDDGMIDRQEFIAPALAMFADRDINGDGVLTAEELPQPPGRTED